MTRELTPAAQAALRAAGGDAAARTAIEKHEVKAGYDYAGKSDLDIARHINLALLLCGGISEQNAGFDTVVGLNDEGLAAIARIVGRVRQATSGPMK